MIPGIKVDMGAKDLAGAPGEKITEGLDGLRERLNEYRELGAKFTKWRAVITIGQGIPERVLPLDERARAFTLRFERRVKARARSSRGSTRSGCPCRS